MAQIDEIAELRAELRHTHLTHDERIAAQTRLRDLAGRLDREVQRDAAAERGGAATDPEPHNRDEA